MLACTVGVAMSDIEIVDWTCRTASGDVVSFKNVPALQIHTLLTSTPVRVPTSSSSTLPSVLPSLKKSLTM